MTYPHKVHTHTYTYPQLHT